ncbi:mannitol dehydrogenase family protein [Pseudocitrobacter cyperus]|uniref:Mannitol dehydrogenase family protein n=1 Tax=Pseudocitrobacter cyperus TaxID=3112843 RepID=A0ABV0HI93_9ENTR
MKREVGSIKTAYYDSATTYSRENLQTDIVHIGFGAFHRGHQAVYTDLANQQIAVPWGIFEINLFGESNLINELNNQHGLFSVLETSATAHTSRQVRSVIGGIHTPEQGIGAAIARLLEPQVKIVSLTITEKGYCIDPQTRQLDDANPLIAGDLQTPHNPRSAIGLITFALQRRKALGLQPFSVLSCDNIPDNGHLTRNAIIGFAMRLDTELAQWIEANVTFPGTMVDRIVPAMTEAQFTMLQEKTGYADPCGIVCEDFRQWVIEDNFVRGRPEWDLAGAMFVSDVQPYEEMKLRMLNGSHSFLAYNGSLAGYEFIYQCMEDPEFYAITRQLMVDEQAQTLNPTLDIDLRQYAELLLTRFSNRNVKHRTAQIAMDGSQKLPQRAITPWLQLERKNIANPVLSLLIAGWLYYVISNIENNSELTDPLLPVFREAIAHQQTGWQKALALLNTNSIFGDLAENIAFINKIELAFNKIAASGIKQTIKEITSGNHK